jgi:outer membrane assembly lipoprotein YfiO
LTKNRALLFLLLFASLAMLGLPGCGPKLAAPEPLVQDLVADARALFDKGKYFDAREKYESIRFDYPGNPYIADVQFHIGACLFQLKDYINAEQELRTFVKEFPADNPFSDDAVFYLCRTLYAQALPARLDQAITKKALEEVDAFLEAYPSSEYLKEVQDLRTQCLDRLAEKEFLAGRLYRRMGYPSAAIHYFRLLETDYPESRWVVRGRYEWSLCGFGEKDYVEAKKMADTCGLLLKALISREEPHFARTEPYSPAYRFFHLYGAIAYEKRSGIKIFIDDLQRDLDRVQRRIDSRLASGVPSRPAPVETTPAPAPAPLPPEGGPSGPSPY